jgi:NADPH-dependent glutamate synthase beta subunit-like oxidoreductase/NAD-dependent dihydropyrimidine dehydrogenase PreA subunit
MGTAIVLMGGLGLLVGIGLAIASKIFYVYVDPTILAIDDVLPGANCGGCGYPGCTSNAEAIVAGKSGANSCVAAGPETAEAIAEILGVSVEATEPDIALPGCTYGVADADTKYVYDGMNDCRAAALLSGGMKVCTIGCLGLGTCAQACPFDAIVMGPKGLPEVDEQRCTGCGTCERVCPKNIITLSSVTRRILQEYTTEHCTTPCQRACPAGINISAYVGAIARKDHTRAVQIIKERNPFPAVIGRICPRPCENECRRQYVDEPVAINYLKRYAADFEKSNRDRILPYKAPDSGRKLAIVGAGVEGLSAAFFTARLGHAVTVYEAGDQLGGLLRTAIARNRLPLEILDWDIEGILAMGVTAHTGVSFGDQQSVIDLLAEGQQAVFLAVGGWDSRLARTAGRMDVCPAPGCHLLIDIVKSSNSQGKAPLTLNGHVVIVGTPNLNQEIIDRCTQLGAATVTVLMQEDEAMEPALSDVHIQTGVGIQRMYGENQCLTGLALTNLQTGEIQRIDADHLVFTAGRIPELIFTRVVDEEASEDAPTDVRWQAFAPYKPPAYHDQMGLMSKGDVLTDFSAAIKAIAAGRRAAATIHKSIYNLPINLPDNVVTPTTQVQNVQNVSRVSERSRQLMPMANGPAVLAKELEKGFSSEQAQEEADRCLQCGLICYLHDDTSETPSSEIAAG